MKRGSIKVMVGRDGKARIQEDCGDSIKVYSSEEWAKEQERRLKAEVEPKEEPKTDGKQEGQEQDGGGQTQTDADGAQKQKVQVRKKRAAKK